MNKELKAAVQALIEEKVIKSDTLFEAIENALITACKSHFGRLENIKVEVDKDSFEYACYAEKTVVELDDDVMDDLIEISLNDARKIDKNAQIGDVVRVDINSQSFGEVAFDSVQFLTVGNELVATTNQSSMYGSFCVDRHGAIE